MENFIRQMSMSVFRVEEESKAQSSRVVRDRKISSRRTWSSKGDSQKSQNWGRKQLSRETSRRYDKTVGVEFRTAVAAAAFAVTSIEYKDNKIKQDHGSKTGKKLSEILEVSQEQETIEDLPAVASRPTSAPPMVATEAGDKVPKKTIGSAASVEKTPSFVADKQLDKKPSQKEPERKLGEVDIWEKTEMEKIKEQFVKLKAKIFEWEKKKKSKAKNKLTRKEGKLEWERAKALHDYKEKMEIIEKISSGARSKNDENRKTKESKVKEKANMIRTTGKITGPAFLCW